MLQILNFIKTTTCALNYKNITDQRDLITYMSILCLSDIKGVLMKPFKLFDKNFTQRL